MLDTEHKHTTNVEARETNVWDAVVALYTSRAEIVAKIITTDDVKIREECQAQINDIDQRVEYLAEL